MADISIINVGGTNYDISVPQLKVDYTTKIGQSRIGDMFESTYRDNIIGAERSSNKTASINTVTSGRPSDSLYPSEKAVVNFVNSSISSQAANYITKDVNGNPFPNHHGTGGLTTVYTFYTGGVQTLPKKGDYAIVAQDEDNQNKQCRYIVTTPYYTTGVAYSKNNKVFYNGNTYKCTADIDANLNTSWSAVLNSFTSIEDGHVVTPVWSFQYTINTTFTDAQRAALDSGITDTIRKNIITGFHTEQTEQSAAILGLKLIYDKIDSSLSPSWVTIPNAATNANGLMSSTDKTSLNGALNNALVSAGLSNIALAFTRVSGNDAINLNIQPATTTACGVMSPTNINTLNGSFSNVSKSSDTDGSINLTFTKNDNNTTSVSIPVATTSVTGLMTAADKSAISNIGNKLTHVRGLNGMLAPNFSSNNLNVSGLMYLCTSQTTYAEVTNALSSGQIPHYYDTNNNQVYFYLGKETSGASYYVFSNILYNTNTSHFTIDTKVLKPSGWTAEPYSQQVKNPSFTVSNKVLTINL